VDEYGELDCRPEDLGDLVERRANAFAVQFLAPQIGAVGTFRAASTIDRLRSVMDRFGVSFTVARYQVWNGSDRTIDFQSLSADRRKPLDQFRRGGRSRR
jgi:hypothetical protein